MSSVDEPVSVGPIRSIHDAYREALAARRQYQQAVGGPYERVAHEALHDAVAGYYEALRPLIANANVTEPLWEDEPLWPTEPAYVAVAICPACGAYVPLDELEDEPVDLNDLCPACETAVIERAEIPETDENGQVVYHYVEGLASIETIWSQFTERVVEWTDALGTHSETRVEPQLVAPEYLQTIARVLDEALERLSLHADVDDDAPTTELDNEDLQAFQEQLAKIRDEFADDGGIDERLDETEVSGS